MSGAIDFSECPQANERTYLGNKANCRCEKCAACGWNKHMAVHGPVYGQPAGSKPYDHEFVPL